MGQNYLGHNSRYHSYKVHTYVYRAHHVLCGTTQRTYTCSCARALAHTHTLDPHSLGNIDTALLGEIVAAQPKMSH